MAGINCGYALLKRRAEFTSEVVCRVCPDPVGRARCEPAATQHQAR